MTESNLKNMKDAKSDNSLKIIIAIIIIILAIIVIYFVANKEKQTNIAEQPVKKVMPKQIETKPAPTIDYSELEKDKNLKKTMEERKKKYDIKNSLDMIVASNETFKIKKYEISMAEILKQAALKRGDVVEENIGSDKKDVNIKQYGIYVVRSGDNIWNIHFNILKEYYSLKNISVGTRVDEPDKKGFSSGVGKILKFSETQVIIYNLEKGIIDSDINIIEPLTKIIIYNMDETFSLLDEINFENVDRLQFDGKTIWISTDT
jgi:hypothetical protein